MKEKSVHPPRLAEWLIRKLASSENKDSIAADIKEEYEEIILERGIKKARYWYWQHTLRSVIPFVSFAFYWKITMFRNYIKIAYRNICKHKGYSFINITGLALGMALCILIYLFIRYELSYDRFHKDTGDIFRVVTRQAGNVYQGSDKWASTPGALAPTMKAGFPEVTKAARVSRLTGVTSYKEKVFEENRFFCVDPDFLEIFNFPVVSGDPKSALVEPFAVLLTTDMVKKYFGDADPIGKTLRLWHSQDFIVKGVLKNVPANSHLKFDFLASFSTMNRLMGGEANVNTWSSLDHYTYIKLQKETNPAELEKKLPGFEKKYQGENPTNKFFLQPVTSIHLFSNLNAELDANSDIRYIYIFSAIAFLIMVIAAFNFMNLATAMSAARAKEVGIKKVFGADRQDLIKQFFSESFLFSLTALILSLFLVELFLPLFNSIIERKLDFPFFNDWEIIIFLTGFLVLMGFFSGFYPSLFLSSFHPVKILKGTFKIGLRDSERFRNPLVVFQFVISIVLITCTIVINNQLNYIKNRKLGYDKNQIVNVLVRDKNLQKNYENLKTELFRNPRISNITASRDLPVHIKGGGYGTKWEGKKNNERLIVYRTFVSYNFIDFYGMELVKGRNFSKDFSSDKNEAYILNETAVRSFGWKKPIGKRIGCFDSSGKRFAEGIVIGIIKDFHFQPLHREIKPLWLRLSTTQNRYVSVKISSENIQSTLNFLKKKFREFSPGYPFVYSFLDNSVNMMYRAEQRLGKLFSGFSFIAIFIASLGVFGLSSFIAERKTREIGIRKVFGASVSDINFMLSKIFLKRVVLSAIISFPLPYFIMNKWLVNFAYRVNFGILTFFAAVVIISTVTFVTAGYHSFKVSKTSPVKVLRYE